MSADKASFRRDLRALVDEFALAEAVHRDAYGGELPEGPRQPEDLLERPTRRFLIDRLLKALDWDADMPGQVIEESRSRNPATDKPLYFDYLGRALDRAPALLVEAKKFDAKLPRQPREQIPSPMEMSRLLSRELGLLKSGGKAGQLLAEWTGWLNDLAGYVQSMCQEDQRRLARVAISSGQWLIVFKAPNAAFVLAGAPDPDSIICFRSFDEMQEGSDEIFDLLSRDRLIDTLPLTMQLGEALAVLDPDDVNAFYRGVVVSTQMVGPQKGTYPFRSVIPAVILASSSHVFAVTRYGAPEPLFEPNDDRDLPAFLGKLAEQGDAFEADVLARLGRLDLEPRPCSDFKGHLHGSMHPPMPASTAARVAANHPPRPRLEFSTGERGAGDERLVVTGVEWFYKLAAATTEACELHFYPQARRRGAAGPNIGQRGGVSSFTSSGEAHHCEDQTLRQQRQGRCHLRAIETHMCCRACVFNSACWTPQEFATLPCPQQPL